MRPLFFLSMAKMRPHHKFMTKLLIIINNFSVLDFIKMITLKHVNITKYIYKSYIVFSIGNNYNIFIQLQLQMQRYNNNSS